MTQHSAEARATDDAPSGRAFPWTGVDQAAAQALVMPLFVVMIQVFAEGLAEMVLEGGSGGSGTLCGPKVQSAPHKHSGLGCERGA